MEIGQRIRANKMCESGFYIKAEGAITGIKNGFILFNADRVMDKWSKKWKDHPTSCATSVKVENAVLI